MLQKGLRGLQIYREHHRRCALVICSVVILEMDRARLDDLSSRLGEPVPAVR